MNDGDDELVTSTSITSIVVEWTVNILICGHAAMLESADGVERCVRGAVFETRSTQRVRLKSK